MSNKRLYVDVHILQTVPPSNLNRDDAGSPKQAIFGGRRRARVSSQAWKRATRKHFAESTPVADQATRTARISALLVQGLLDRMGIEADQAARVAAMLLAQLNIKGGRKEDTTAYLLFLGRSQIAAIVEKVVAALPDGPSGLDDAQLKDVLAAVNVQHELMAGHPLEVALFGRMVADLPSLNVDASVQVAHAISTHEIEGEYDYFTAVDDENDRSTTGGVGAGMIGTVEFNSATLYRYAALGVHQLVDNLGGMATDATGGLEKFVDSFAKSMPTGHQNSFAHRTLPDAVVVVVREDQPVNLASAFERPIRPGGEGFAATSLAALAGAHENVERLWGSTPIATLASYGPRSDDAAVSSAFGQPLPFSQLLTSLSLVVSERLAGQAP